MCDKERGNILFLILLAIILFAALSYAVTNSIRGGGKDISPEVAKARATELVEYFSGIRSAITRLQLTNNCSVAQISLDYNNGASNCLTSELPATGYENSNSPTDCRCHVFHPKGGGVSHRAFDKFGARKNVGNVASSYINFPSRSSVPFIGTPLSELYALVMLSGISDGTGLAALCDEYNKIVGARSVNIAVVQGGLWGSPFYTGSFSDNASFPSSAFNNLPAACYLYTGGQTYFAYFVLLER